MNYPYYGGYMPQYQPQQMQPTQMSATNHLNTDERIWVQNETAAEAYLVAANSFVRLWDSSRPVFYEKHADASGRPYPITAYKYEKIENQPSFSENGTSVYEQRITSLEARISALEGMRIKEDHDGEFNSESNDAFTAD